MGFALVGVRTPIAQVTARYANHCVTKIHKCMLRYLLAPVATSSGHTRY